LDDNSFSELACQRHPHLDIREDRVSEALFAVNLSRAIARQGADEYRDPALFFARTCRDRRQRGA
jgi:predicted AAA+ superfamily ATPase